MSLLDLNQDVLVAIVSFLSSADAWVLGQTCSQAHMFTLPHCLADVFVPSGQLGGFCACVLAEGHRPHYLKKLAYHYTFRDMWTLPSLAQVLDSADRLETLSVHNMESALEDGDSSSLCAALVSCRTLRNITFTELYGIGDLTLDVLSTMTCPLTKLRLSKMMGSVRNNKRRLATVLQPFTNSLGELDLEYIPFVWRELRELGSVAVWPRMHTLRLKSTHLNVLLGIPKAFPNLQVLHWDIAEPWDAFGANPNAGNGGLDADDVNLARWPKLDMLSCQYCPPMTAAVRHVCLLPRARTGDPLILTFLRRSSPTVFTCSLRRDLLLMTGQVQPSLRYLTLREDNETSQEFPADKESALEIAISLLRTDMQLVGLSFQLFAAPREIAGSMMLPISYPAMNDIAQTAALRLPNLQAIGFKVAAEGDDAKHSGSSLWFRVTTGVNGAVRGVIQMSQLEGDEAESTLSAMGT